MSPGASRRGIFYAKMFPIFVRPKPHEGRMSNNPNPATHPSYETALTLHMQGRLDEAERLYAAFLQSHPDHSEALHGLGVILLQSGRIDAAIDNLRKAVSTGGSDVVKNNLGVALCKAARLAEAAEVYRDILRSAPNALVAKGNLGQILNQLGQFSEAAEVLEQALVAAPNNARHHNQLAIALAECGHGEKAAAHFTEAVLLDPTQVQYRCDLAAWQISQGRAEEAAEQYRRVLTISPNAPLALCGLGKALGHMNQHNEAALCFRQAIARAPNFAQAHYDYGTALTYLGRLPEAETAFLRAMELEPENPAYLGALIAMNSDMPSANHLATLEKVAAKEHSLGKQEQMELQFTLARAYNDSADYKRAFEALKRGNDLRRAIHPYDVDEDLDRFKCIAAAFTQDFLVKHADIGDQSDCPVFIVGMPRSGTTLVEQILASHPDIFGAGELGLLPDLISTGRAGADFPKTVQSLAPEEWRTIGQDYVSALKIKASQALRITDKLPLNFQLLGLITIAMPRARIIHVSRNPLDTCFSCHFTLFASGLGFRDDLDDLGRYYKGYSALMEHWRSVLPQGAMLEVQYENLVSDLESEAKRMLDYCGLNWDSHCLEFHKTVRPVETASTLQVRKPLYDSSIGRTRHYQPWLEPLRQALAATD